MKWITITSPEFISGEATFISKLFSQGQALFIIPERLYDIKLARDLAKP